MMKKLALIFAMIFVPMHAQDFDQQAMDLALQELIYDMGMSLSDQDLIVDGPSAKNALLNVYQQVEQVAQIIELFMIIDEELVALDISTIDNLIDFELNHHPVMAQACINLLSAYQNLFILFIQLHGQNVSFEVWCQDVQLISSLPEGQEFLDPAYEQLWQASYDVIEAQKDFEDSLENLE